MRVKITNLETGKEELRILSENTSFNLTAQESKEINIPLGFGIFIERSVSESVDK